MELYNLKSNMFQLKLSYGVYLYNWQELLKYCFFKYYHHVVIEQSIKYTELFSCYGVLTMFSIDTVTSCYLVNRKDT